MAYIKPNVPFKSIVRSWFRPCMKFQSIYCLLLHKRWPLLRVTISLSKILMVQACVYYASAPSRLNYYVRTGKLIARSLRIATKQFLLSFLFKGLKFDLLIIQTYSLLQTLLQYTTVFLFIYLFIINLDVYKRQVDSDACLF